VAKIEYLQLTRDTLAAFGEAIPISELSKTFQDAISVTLRLGIRYLWIDSLCIMQDKDDLSDWLREASAMGKVYLHSHCNISASVSMDGSQGLSRERDLARMYPPRVRFLSQGFDVETEFEHAEYRLLDHDIWAYNVNESTINSRGWVYQERLLAPRILHFSHDQLFWECREGMACELIPEGDELRMTGEDMFLSIFRSCFEDHPMIAASVSSPSAKHDALDETEFQAIWFSLIRSYSSTILTNPHDKLVALSGIAKFMSAFTRGTYIAGMWRQNLEKNLLWYRNEGHTHEVISRGSVAVYRAPTWSWASQDGAVEFCDPEFSLAMSVRDVFLQHKTNDVTGHVTNGWLDISGQLGPITLVSIEREDTELDRGAWVIYTDSACIQPKQYLSAVVFLDNYTPNARSFDDDNAAGRLFFMPCTLWKEKPEAACMYAMVLRVIKAESGIFERLGIVYVPGERDSEGDVITVLPTHIDEAVNAKLPCMKYEDGLHTIRII
jgi:hypothetical protein